MLSSITPLEQGLMNAPNAAGVQAARHTNITLVRAKVLIVDLGSDERLRYFRAGLGFSLVRTDADRSTLECREVLEPT